MLSGRPDPGRPAGAGESRITGGANPEESQLAEGVSSLADLQRIRTLRGQSEMCRNAQGKFVLIPSPASGLEDKAAWPLR
jgi:hypothetical protein